MHRGSLVFAVSFALFAACGSEQKVARSDDPSREPDEDAGKPRDAGKDARVDASKGTGKTDAGSATDHDDAGTGPKTGTPATLIDDCGKSGGLDAKTVAALEKGGDPAGVRLVYPYDGTVFPRGIEGPLLMWEGMNEADAVLVHIKAAGLDYRGCFKPTAPSELQIPQDVWDTAGDRTLGQKDPFVVEVTFSAAGTVRGPFKQKWVIAQATIKGSVYYNSYFNLTVGLPGGKVFRIPPKGKAEGVTVTECNGCHSLSANGTRMTSQTLGLGGRSYDLEGGAPMSLPAPVSNAYAAMYPDGSRYVTGSQVIDVGRTNIATQGAAKSALVETDTGAVLKSSGIPADVLMPSFSPDGSLLVFNDYAIDTAHGLAMVTFDGKTNTASNYRKLLSTPGVNRPAWPFLLPDNEGVVFVNTASPDFSGLGAGVGTALTAVVAPYSDLFMVDVSSGESTVMARAMGYATAADYDAKKTNLPYGAEDTGKNYFPTVSPVAAGGYFWVFFDSLRHYGTKGLSRQLWGTAVSIQRRAEGEFRDDDRPLYDVDVSAPAFYIPGQEFGTGNHRAFTALDPCKADGESCESGVDCCGGSCDKSGSSGAGVCRVIVECAKTEERCKTDKDCCPPESDEDQLNTCIAGYCTVVVAI
ncbi:MAG: hypothetical protein RLZZ450_7369 [Pseudomonadota bacterium]|jgi:hypothetical protein